MASVHRRPETNYFHGAWRDGDGRLHFRSTKQTERAKALAVVLEWERAEKKATEGNLTEAQALEVVADILKRTGQTLRVPTIREYFDTWFKTWKEGASDSTVVRYEGTINAFLDHLADKATAKLTSLTIPDVQSFIDKRKRAKLAPATIQVDGKIIRSVLNRAKKLGLIPTNPAEAVDLPERESIERGTFSPEAICKLVDTAEGDWKTMILLGYYCGARLGDCCNMKWSGDILKGNVREGVEFTKETLTYKQQKTGKIVTIPLHPELQAHLESITPDTNEKHLCPSMAGANIGGRNGISKQFIAIMKKAGIDSQVVKGSGVRSLATLSFHALRHSFTSALLNAGVNQELRMKLTGHTSEKVHAGYSHHEIKVLAEAIAKLPRISKTEGGK